MSNQTYSNVNSNELHCYPFMVTFLKYNQSCNALDDLSRRICIATKTEYVDLNAYNMITRMNKPKTLTKHISCNCK